MLSHRLVTQQHRGRMMSASRYQNPLLPIRSASFTFRSPMVRTAKNIPCSRVTRLIICLAASSMDVIDVLVRPLTVSSQKRPCDERAWPWISNGPAASSFLLETFLFIRCYPHVRLSPSLCLISWPRWHFPCCNTYKSRSVAQHPDHPVLPDRVENLVRSIHSTRRIFRGSGG